MSVVHHKQLQKDRPTPAPAFSKNLPIMPISIQLFPSGATIPLKWLIFGGGESHVKLSPECPDWSTLTSELASQQRVNVECLFNQDSDLVRLALVKDVIDHALLTIPTRKRPDITLSIPYFPGSRQDRYCAEGEPFSAKVYANMVNAMGFDSVRIADPHSDVIVALIKNCVPLDNHKFIENVVKHLGFKGDILSPDAGSNKKIFGLVAALREKGIGDFKVIRADKKRDCSNGKIVGSEILADSLEGKDLLIIDDICSYGGTFYALASEAKKLGAKRIFLAVTHYEGVAEIRRLNDSGIDAIFTSNNKQDVKHENLITILY